MKVGDMVRVNLNSRSQRLGLGLVMHSSLDPEVVLEDTCCVKWAKYPRVVTEWQHDLEVISEGR